MNQHLQDRILENMTFSDLYENRIVTTLAPIQTYVFEKWHYQRIITIGDSAHKVSTTRTITNLEKEHMICKIGDERALLT